MKGLVRNRNQGRERSLEGAAPEDLPAATDALGSQGQRDRCCVSRSDASPVRMLGVFSDL